MSIYTSHCQACQETWQNTAPNCPYCGLEDMTAIEVGAETPKNSKRATKKKAAKPMNEQDTISSTFAKAAADAVKQGGMLAAANESNEIIKALVSKGLIAAGASPEALEGAIFQKGLPVMSSAFLLFLCERFPDLIPKSEFVAKAASLALTSASAETFQPMLRAVTPALLAIASKGEKIAELQGDVYEEEDEFEEEVEAETEDEYQDAEYSEREVEVTPRTPPRSTPTGVDPAQVGPRRS